MAELWKPVYGYEELYEVSDQGRVRSLPRVSLYRRGYGVRQGRILRPQTRSHGYLSVWLWKGKTKKQVSIHRLVAEAFCEKKDGSNEVNHLNENKQDNRAENLVWCNRSENCSYGEKLADKRKLWRNNRRSTPVRQLTMDGEVVAEYPSLHEAKRQTGISEGGIYSAANGITHQSHGFKWEYISRERSV